jgi:(p)ppGpp synthase/HD superfamily hydrolase
MERLILEAKNLMLKAHKEQKDKLGEPYKAHLIAVASILKLLPSYEALSEEEKILSETCALLHDIIEDTFITEKHLEALRYPAQVIEVVKLLTYNKSESREDYYQKIKANKIARLVKFADISHNASFDRIKKLDDETQIRLNIKYAKASEALLSRDEQEWFKSFIK